MLAELPKESGPSLIIQTHNNTTIALANNQSTYIHADTWVGLASNINVGLYQHMHALQEQQLQSLHPRTPQCTEVCSCRQAE